jgi:hypothetical protein
VASEIKPRAGISYADLEDQVRALINAQKEVLACSWSEECKHVKQMVRSGYGLNYEELLALLTSLSELAFVKTCLKSLGLAGLQLSEPPAAPELRDFLMNQRSVYPTRWSIARSIVLDSKEHWWWSKPIT